MRIAAFNVENLFDRPKAFNLDDHAKGAAITEAVTEINVLINKEVYSAADKARMLVLIKQLKLTSSNPPFVNYRKIRGAFWKQPKTGPMVIVANGRADWVGWVELKTEPNNAVAVMNTGRVIKEVGADILAVIEAENRIALMQFSDQVLKKLGGEPYDEIMLIDGNDDRGIDVGLMVTNGYSVGLMRSHIADILPNGERVFSRDCPEYQVTTPSGETIWILPNHFKSKFGGNDQNSIDKRTAQATRTAEIYEALRTRGEDRIVVLGDLNDTPDAVPLQRLLAQTDLKEITDHPSFSPGKFKGIGTYSTGSNGHKIDYMLLSPALFARVTGGGPVPQGCLDGLEPLGDVSRARAGHPRGERPSPDLGGDFGLAAERVLDVSWPAPGREKDHVEAQRRFGPSRMARLPILRCPQDALLVDALQRFELGRGGPPGLDLDKDHGAEALGDEIDLSHRGFVAARQDAVELEAQEQGRERLPAMAAELGRDAGLTFRL